MITLLRNAELYDPAPRGRRHLLVGGELVLWVGREVPALDGALEVAEVDLGGRRVIPGLIDGHVHLTGGGGEAGPETRVPPVELSRLTLGGVTTAVGVLGTDDAVRTTAELVTVARGLVAQGLSAWCHTGGYHVPPTTATGSVRLDIALIDLVIGVGELAISDHRSSQPTLDELLRVAGDAHVGGLMSGKAGIVHLHVGDGPRGLELVREALDRSEVPAAVFNPTHVNRRRALFDEAVALTERGCTIDITAFPVAEGEDAWSAEEAVVRYLDGGAGSVAGDGELGWRRLPAGVRRRGPGGVVRRGEPVGLRGDAPEAAWTGPGARAGAAGVHGQSGAAAAVAPEGAAPAGGGCRPSGARRGRGGRGGDGAGAVARARGAGGGARCVRGLMARQPCRSPRRGVS